MFLPHSHDKGALQPWEYIAAAADTYQVGQLLDVTNGQLSAISAAKKTTPAYVCMASKTVAAGEELPVQRVSKDVIYETHLSAEAAAAKAGTLLEISTGGLLADAAAAGTFEVVYLEGTAAGSVVRGRFQ